MIRVLMLAVVIAMPTASQAQSSVQDLSRCLADNTTGRDRKDLAKWVFLAIASHPEIKKFTSDAAAAGAEEADRTTASLFTRLLSDSCLAQTQLAIKEGGASSIQAAFQTLGQLAMQELVSERDVKAKMAAFEKYLDQNKINQALSPK